MGDQLIERKLRRGYDLGKGCVTCRDDISNAVDEMIVDPILSKSLKILLKETKTQMIRQLGQAPRFVA